MRFMLAILWGIFAQINGDQFIDSQSMTVFLIHDNKNLLMLFVIKINQWRPPPSHDDLCGTNPTIILSCNGE